MVESPHLTCICCGKRADHTLKLEVTCDRCEHERYNIPKMTFSPASERHKIIRDTPFCSECMQLLEFAVRGAIRTLQHEHGMMEQRFREQFRAHGTYSINALDRP